MKRHRSEYFTSISYMKVTESKGGYLVMTVEEKGEKTNSGTEESEKR